MNAGETDDDNLFVGSLLAVLAPELGRFGLWPTGCRSQPRLAAGTGRTDTGVPDCRGMPVSGSRSRPLTRKLTLNAAHPWAMDAAPGRVVSVTRARKRTEPAPLTTSTRSPSATPAASASTGWSS